MIGPEERLVAAIIDNAVDRSALSDELHFAANTAALRNHLDHGAANSLRALDLSRTTHALELDAECGALTRYLGEAVARVTAVESEPELASVVAARTGDLGNVAVVGSLSELPSTSRYDLVVARASSMRPGVLRAIGDKLTEDAVICAFTSVHDELTRHKIHNGLLERNCPNRSEVELALSEANFGTMLVLRCVPDHQITRAVLTDGLEREQPRLARALCEPDTGTCGDFLLVAGSGTTALWQRERLATYFNTAERSAPWCTRADVIDSGSGTLVRRSPLERPAPIVGGITVRERTDPVYDAPTMLEVLLDQPWRTPELLTGWRSLLSAESATAGNALWDLVPHNVLVDDTRKGEVRLHPIDLDWVNAESGIDEVTERGLLVLAHQLTEANWSGAARGAKMRDTAGWLGILLGIEPSFVELAVAREVEFAAIGSAGVVEDGGDLRDKLRAIWQARLDSRVGCTR